MTRKLFAPCAALGLFLAAPTPALATPPDVIDIREEPFGLSDTHMFVTRTSDDNLGLYESLRVESFLFAINLETGEEEVWPMDRLTQFSEYSDDGEFRGYRVKRDTGSMRINPYAVLAERSGVPWAAISQAGGDMIAPEVTQSEAGITATYKHGPVYTISNVALAEHLEKVGASMTANVADHPRMSSLTTKGLFADRSVPVDSCKAEGVLEYWALGRKADQKFLRVNCSDMDEVGTTSVVVRLDLVPGTAPEY